MTVVKNDVFMLSSSFNNLIVGKHYEVANFTGTNVILREQDTKVAVACVDMFDLECNFTPVLPDFKCVWTDWVAVMNPDRQAYFYRTNGKKVQVKCAECHGEASCNVKHGDRFDLSFGIQLALLDCKARAKSRKLDQMTKDLENQSNAINRMVDEMIDINETKKRLVNSYYFTTDSNNVVC